LWFYRFLEQRELNLLAATPADLTEFVIWLCNPHRDIGKVEVMNDLSPLQSTSVNLVLQAVGALYRFLVRRGELVESPVRYVDVPRGKWLTERDLLAHTRHGQHLVQRSELKLKEPVRMPPTISEQDFQTFVDSIRIGGDPNNDPPGFRDRLLCLMLKEGGFRLGELLGIHMEDLDFGKQGVYVRFRTDNQNGARAHEEDGRVHGHFSRMGWPPTATVSDLGRGSSSSASDTSAPHSTRSARSTGSSPGTGSPSDET
jgi:integrase/recombinase XerD